MNTPSIGRVVHYQGPGNATAGGPGGFAPTTYPAHILGVRDGDSCDLFVMTHVGHMSLSSIPFSETPKAGHWNWPPRV